LARSDSRNHLRPGASGERGRMSAPHNKAYLDY